MANAPAQESITGVSLSISEAIIAPSTTFMSLPDLVMHRIVHYVLDASETDECYSEATGGHKYVWDLSIFRVNKTLYAHAKAVWESNHFILVSSNSTSFYYQFQQYKIPIAAPYFISFVVEDRKHKLKCHLHVTVDVDITHISELDNQQYDPHRFHIFDLDEDEPLERVEARADAINESDQGSSRLEWRIFFVICHQDLPDFVRALREIDITFTCHSHLVFDMQTLFSGTPLPPKTQRLLLDPFKIMRTLPGQCTISEAVNPNLAKEITDHLTRPITWTSAEVPSDIYYLTAWHIQEADAAFVEGNLNRAAAILDETANHWSSLKQRLPTVFDDNSEAATAESFLYALSANQARLNLEKTVRTPLPAQPRITRQGPSHRAPDWLEGSADLRELMWTIEEFGNAMDTVAEQGFAQLQALYQDYVYLLALRTCRAWLFARSKATEQDVMSEAHAQGLSVAEWQAVLEQRSRRACLEQLVGMLPPHLCKPIFERTFDIIPEY